MTGVTPENLKQVTADLLRALGVVGEVTVDERDGGWVATIETPDSALLIGWRGGTLAALEYLVRTLLFRQLSETEQLSEIHLDVGGYKLRQEAEITDVARERAAAVKTSGEAAVLRPMNAYERRLVHVALADDAAVTTESIGVGPNRRIIIKPKV